MPSHEPASHSLSSSPMLPQFDELFERAQNAILILDAKQGTILSANHKARMLLKTGDPLPPGIGIEDFSPRESESYRAFNEMVENHGLAWPDVLTLVAKGKERINVSVSASGFTSENRRYILLSMEDSNEKERRWAETERARRRHYVDLLDTFSRDVLNITSHSLRTPMTPILVQVEILERSLRGLMNEDQLQRFDQIRRNLARLNTEIEAIARAAIIRSEEQRRITEERMDRP